VRIALYQNLKPGGALRALNELLRRSSRVHEYHLYESSAAAAFRVGAPMSLQPERFCAETHRFDLPALRLRHLPVGRGNEVRKLWQLRALDRRMADEINRRGYDIVLVHPCWVRQTPSIVSRLDAPVVFYMQEPRRASFEAHFREVRADMFVEDSDRAAMVKAIDRRALAAADAVIARADAREVRTPDLHVLCNSVHSQERILSAYGVTAHLSYLGVDETVFAPDDAARREVQRGDVFPTPYVLAVGPLDPMKGHELVIDALAFVPRNRRAALMIVCNDREGSRYEMHLQAKARATGVELRFARAVDDAELARVYRSAAATICAAELEPFGLSALESIACGTPVVAIRQGGYRETVFDGCTGELADPDAPALGAAIIDVLASHDRFHPTALRRWICENRWTWDDAVERLHAQFKSARR
jgi:glycosyltransferase involved in cell wall biosynthesis